uniref:Uncharacterized protein n=1 Tax=Plectus sambesii TaxID=2011161 RepID=A0A914UM30_9BILA
MSVATIDAIGMSNFNHRDNKYTCCCGNIHVLSATRAIAVLCVILLVCEALTCAQNVVEDDFTSNYGLMAQILSLVIGSFVLTALVLGLLFERKLLLLPFIFSMSLTTIFMSLLIFFLLIVLLGNFQDILMSFLTDETRNSLNGNPKGEAVIRVALALSIVIMLMILSVQLWWLSICINCYRYLSDKRKAWIRAPV